MKLLGLCILAVASALAAGQAEDVPEAARGHFEVIQRTRSRLFQAHEHAKGLIDVAIEDSSQAVEKEGEIRRLLTEALRTHGNAEGVLRGELEDAKAAAGEPLVRYSEFRGATNGAWSVKEILARMEDEGAIVLGEKAEALTDELREVRSKLADALSKATAHALESETLAKESPEKKAARKAGMDNSFASTHKAYTLLRRATEIRESLEDTQELIAETIKRETEARELVPAEDCPAHFLDSAERTGEVDDKLPVQQEFVCRALVLNELSHFESVKEMVKEEEQKEAAEGVCAGVRRIYSLKRHANAPQRACARIRVVVGEVASLGRFRKYLKHYECDASASKNATCNGNGVCKKSKCFCRPGWTSADCSIRTCPEGCSGNGFCNRGECRCSEGWTGETCAIRDCPKHHGVRCGENGMCQRNNQTLAYECLCAPGYKGLACEQPVCPFGEGEYKFECSGRGSCSLAGKCKCFRGFGGNACEKREVKHGYCNKKGGCVCDKGYTGAACDLLECPLNCSGDNGVCDGFVGKCLCKRGWRGDGCQFVDPQCPLTKAQKAEEKKMNETGLLSRPLHFKHCSARGLCKPVEEGSVEGKCVCPPGWVGDSCQFEDCPGEGCSKGRRGLCHRDADGSNAKCSCFTGYGGEDCSEKLDVPVECGQECFNTCLHAKGCKVERAAGKHNRNAHLYTEKRSRVEQEAIEKVLSVDLPPSASVSSGKMNACFMACTHQCVAERCWTRGAEYTHLEEVAEE